MENEMTFQELQEVLSVCLDEIIKLKQENETLQQKVNFMDTTLLELLKCNKDLISNIKSFELTQSLINNSINNIKYELLDPNINQEDIFFPQFYGIEDTLKLLIDEKKSMARFGDGEFAIMSHKIRHSFQQLDTKLSQRLTEIIQSNEKDFLIGIADNYGSLEKYGINSRQEIRMYMTDQVRKEHQQFLQKNRKYHNAYISRPYVLYADSHTDGPKKRFESLKKIWDNRNVIFVEGSLTRLGVGNNLFDNAASIHRIEAPPVNSFDKYDDILKACLKYADSDTLFLIALGPSAGVLAYDLYKSGYQAIDIGHLDLEYEWYLKGLGKRCEIKHKYNNEVIDGENVEDIHDELYFSQIISIID